jgi:hypothetical protein
LVANPSSVAFGNVAVNSKRSVVETLSNSGSYSFTVTKAVSSGAMFKLSGCTLPFTLRGRQSKTCALTFAPTAVGSVSGSVTIYWRNYGGYTRYLKIPVSGTGVSGSIGTLSGTPSSLNFATVQTGSSSTLAETVSNSGNAAVTISQVGISGSGFSFNGINPPVTLSAGQSVKFNVVFTPQSGTSASGSLAIGSNASNPTLAIALSGAGASAGTVSVSPASTSFGNVVVGTRQSKTATLSASGGPVTVSSIGLNGSGFSVSGLSLPLSLAAGQSAPFTVTFAPPVVGSLTGTVTFLTSGSGSATQTDTGNGIAAPQHSVTLNWSPSTSSSVLGYYVYRGGQAGGPYTALNSAADPNSTFVDNSVQGGQTYYYVVTAVNSSGLQSGYSNQVQAVIPFP